MEGKALATIRIYKLIAISLSLQWCIKSYEIRISSGQFSSQHCPLALLNLIFLCCFASIFDWLIRLPRYKTYYGLMYWSVELSFSIIIALILFPHTFSLCSAHRSHSVDFFLIFKMDVCCSFFFDYTHFRTLKFDTLFVMIMHAWENKMAFNVNDFNWENYEMKI